MMPELDQTNKENQIEDNIMKLSRFINNDMNKKILEVKL